MFLGVILPGDTAKVEVHFRSKIPGYFSETWLLHTIPLIAAGAEIKFVLKGVARQTKEFTQECLLLEVGSLMNIQSTLVISKSKELPEMFRDTHTLICQICRTEEKIKHYIS